MGIGTLDERKRQSGAEPKSDRWLKQYSRLLIHAENDHVTVRQETLPHVFVISRSISIPMSGCQYPILPDLVSRVVTSVVHR
jgi:hypothetical protein